MCYELNCSSEIFGQRGAQFFKFHLETLFTSNFLIPGLASWHASQPTTEPSISAELTSGRPPPTQLWAASCSFNGNWKISFCAPQYRKREKELSESSSLTHRVSDEILQGASLNKLRYQIEPLILVQHTDKLQNVGVIKTSHYFDLNIRHKQTSS